LKLQSFSVGSVYFSSLLEKQDREDQNAKYVSQPHVATVLNSAHLVRIPIDEHLGLAVRQSFTRCWGGANAVVKDDTSLCSAESDVEGGGL